MPSMPHGVTTIEPIVKLTYHGSFNRVYNFPITSALLSIQPKLTILGVCIRGDFAREDSTANPLQAEHIRKYKQKVGVLDQ